MLIFNQNNTSKNITIVGFDPGLGTTGYGVIKVENNRPTLLAVGVLTTNKSNDLAKRLVELKQKTAEILNQWSPQLVGIEKLLIGKNVSTVIDVAQARGALLTECASRGLRVVELTPMQIKLNITGFGRASKGQVNRLLKVQLGITQPITPDDASDALAVAIAVSGY